MVMASDPPYRKPHVHTNLTALSYIELELLPIEVLHVAIGNCCCCDLDLDPMTFIYELDSYLLAMYLQSKIEPLESYIILHTCRQMPP